MPNCSFEEIISVITTRDYLLFGEAKITLHEIHLNMINRHSITIKWLYFTGNKLNTIDMFTHSKVTLMWLYNGDNTKYIVKITGQGDTYRQRHWKEPSTSLWSPVYKQSEFRENHNNTSFQPHNRWTVDMYSCHLVSNYLFLTWPMSSHDRVRLIISPDIIKFEVRHPPSVHRAKHTYIHLAKLLSKLKYLYYMTHQLAVQYMC